MIELKIAFLFLGIFFSIVNFAKMTRKSEEISSISFILQTIGIVGFITLQFKLLH